MGVGIRSEEFYGDAELDFGQRLAKDCGYTPIYLRYNSGRPISDNGRELSEMLDAVIEAYPCDVKEIALVGHSMGGLVARSAAHRGAQGGAVWVAALRHVICIGSPHLGAPLERSVNVLASILSSIETAATQVIGEVLDIRSEGIKDLRYGYTIDDKSDSTPSTTASKDGLREVPCVPGVAYYGLAATITRDPSHPLGQILGDWLVRLPSATGESTDEQLPFEQTKVFGGLDHVTLANHPDVYTTIRQWLLAADETRP